MLHVDISGIERSIDDLKAHFKGKLDVSVWNDMVELNARPYIDRCEVLKFKLAQSLGKALGGYTATRRRSFHDSVRWLDVVNRPRQIDHPQCFFKSGAQAFVVSNSYDAPAHEVRSAVEDRYPHLSATPVDFPSIYFPGCCYQTIIFRKDKPL